MSYSDKHEHQSRVGLIISLYGNDAMVKQQQNNNKSNEIYERY